LPKCWQVLGDGHFNVIKYYKYKKEDKNGFFFFVFRVLLKMFWFSSWLSRRHSAFHCFYGAGKSRVTGIVGVYVMVATHFIFKMKGHPGDFHSTKSAIN